MASQDRKAELKTINHGFPTPSNPAAQTMSCDPRSRCKGEVQSAAIPPHLTKVLGFLGAEVANPSHRRPLVVDTFDEEETLLLMGYLPYFLGKGSLNGDSVEVAPTEPLLVMCAMAPSLLKLKCLFGSPSFLGSTMKCSSDGAPYCVSVVPRHVRKGREVVLAGAYHFRLLRPDLCSAVIIYESNALSAHVIWAIMDHFECKVILVQTPQFPKGNLDVLGEWNPINVRVELQKTAQPIQKPSHRGQRPSLLVPTLETIVEENEDEEEEERDETTEGTEEEREEKVEERDTQEEEKEENEEEPTEVEDEEKEEKEEAKDMQEEEKEDKIEENDVRGEVKEENEEETTEVADQEKEGKEEGKETQEEQRETQDNEEEEEEEPTGITEEEVEEKEEVEEIEKGEKEETEEEEGETEEEEEDTEEEATAEADKEAKEEEKKGKEITQCITQCRPVATSSETIQVEDEDDRECPTQVGGGKEKKEETDRKRNEWTGQRKTETNGEAAPSRAARLLSFFRSLCSCYRRNRN